MPGNLTVRAKALGGTWETIGADRARGVWPENFQAASDPWGMTTASFDLRRESSIPWPDVALFADVEVEEDGRVIWDGRVKETPARDAADGAVLNVQCEGWAAHLTDDMYQRMYLSTSLSDWADTRSLPDCELTAFTSVGQVGTGSGVLTLGWAKDSNIGALAHVGVTVDLGPWGLATDIAVDVLRQNGGSTQSFIIRGHDRDSANPPAGYYEDANVTALSSITSTGQTMGGTFSGAWRYITLLLLDNPGHTAQTNDIVVSIKAVRIFGNHAWQALGTSALKASVVIRDALTTACPLLSDDQSQIADTTFNIPDLSPDSPLTPREYIDGVNVYHGYRTKIALGRIPVFQPQPDAPVVEVGKHIGDGAMDFDDASTSGDEVFNRVYATAPAADGTTLSLKLSRQATNDLLDVPPGTAPTLSNPSFSSGITGWTVPSGTTAVWQTSDFHTAPGALWWTSDNHGVLSTVWSGTFLAGVPYVIQWWAKGASVGSVYDFRLSDGSVNIYATANNLNLPDTWTPYRLGWTPTKNTTSVQLRIHNARPVLDAIYLDDITLGTITPTMIDRRGFVRTYQLSVQSTLPNDGVALRQISSVWLDQHRTSPFRGTLTVAGNRTIRQVATGRYLRPAELLDLTGERIRLADRTDPDTGGHGRDGIIAAVSYDQAGNRATVTLDSSRSNLDAVLARMGVIQGSA